jgi:hypothetical protein
MITVPGTLFIRTLHGRNGAFSVGRLATGIGTFAVKDALLDQYDPGQYAGVFDIARIFPAAYACHGQMVVEARAKLVGMALAAIGSLPDNRPQDIAADPIEPELSPPAEEAPAPEEPPALAPDPAPEAQGLGAAPGDPEGKAEDARLFGPLWPPGGTLRLDTTVERTLLRRQRDRLKALGYCFDAKTQTWSMPEAWLTPN